MQAGLGYCNSLLVGVAYLQRLSQSVVARLISGARHHDHVTPVLDFETLLH